MDITITPSLLSGQVEAVPSKSWAHRVFICAALSDRPTTVICGPVCQDVAATIDCLQALGARMEATGTGYQVFPIEKAPERATLFCKESGATLRFLLPLVGALGVSAQFVMEGRLPQRPLSSLWEEMERMGCRLSRRGENRILCDGKLRSGKYRMEGGVSSQFISGLKMALPLLPGSSLEILGEVPSRPYIAMTDAVMALFPAREPIAIEGDWSSAAFFLGANALGSDIRVAGLSQCSAQGDRAVISLLKALDSFCTIHAADVPDLVPILAVVACCKQGAEFRDISRLRLKESDRVEAIAEMLHSLGGRVEATENSLTVYPAPLLGGCVKSYGDHRIAMAAAIAATVCKKPVTITGAECVAKSYPGFWEDYRKLGGCL